MDEVEDDCGPIGQEGEGYELKLVRTEVIKAIVCGSARSRTISSYVCKASTNRGEMLLLLLCEQTGWDDADLGGNGQRQRRVRRCEENGRSGSN